MKQLTLLGLRSHASWQALPSDVQSSCIPSRNLDLLFEGHDMLCSSTRFSIASSSMELYDQLEQLDSRTIYIDDNITVPVQDWPMNIVIANYRLVLLSHSLSQVMAQFVARFVEETFAWMLLAASHLCLRPESWHASACLM